LIFSSGSVRNLRHFKVTKQVETRGSRLGYAGCRIAGAVPGDFWRAGRLLVLLHVRFDSISYARGGDEKSGGWAGNSPQVDSVCRYIRVLRDRFFCRDDVRSPSSASCGPTGLLTSSLTICSDFMRVRKFTVGLPI